MKELYNNFELFKSAIDEKGLTVREFEKACGLTENGFYDLKDSYPTTKNAIAMANVLNMSFDYIYEKSDINQFKKYKTEQIHFYENLLALLKSLGILRTKLSNDLHISRSTFQRWKNGATPSFKRILEIANFINCNFDDLLETEK